MDTSTGDIAAFTQGAGQPVTSQLSALGPGNILDDKGDRAVFCTNTPGMLDLGSGPASQYTPTNVLETDVSSLSFLPPGEIRGCQCLNSLGATAPLQDMVGDPINTATGAYTDSADDVALPGAGVAVDFRRTYDSSNTAASASWPRAGHAVRDDGGHRGIGRRDSDGGGHLPGRLPPNAGRHLPA